MKYSWELHTTSTSVMKYRMYQKILEEQIIKLKSVHIINKSINGWLTGLFEIREISKSFYMYIRLNYPCLLLLNHLFFHSHKRTSLCIDLSWHTCIVIYVQLVYILVLICILLIPQQTASWWGETWQHWVQTPELSERCCQAFPRNTIKKTWEFK